jgi:sugar-specific transcriptional regulator TrmB
MQLLEHRAYLDRKEREFQKELEKVEKELERKERIHSDLIGKNTSGYLTLTIFIFI